MKYCCKYFSGSTSLKESDEISIEYDKKSAKLIDFVNKYNDKTIVVSCLNCNFEDLNNSFEIFEVVKDNIKLLINYEQYITLPVNALDDFRFFFPNIIDTVDKLKFVCSIKVSDVYIGDSLGFQIKSIAPYLKNQNIEIRVIPNLNQEGTFAGYENISSSGFTGFYIRPEDMALYEDFVDIYEFYATVDKQDVLYEIYKEEKWLGDLSDIIVNLGNNIDNKNIVPEFGKRRLNCGRKCVYDQCHACDIYTNFAETLNSINVKVEGAE